ncbi:DUF3152 domain-containing protein [Luteipulveratus sp. YIM 133132]|uniref:DUF3152 domain-containing protein n=1 Tax=Luteipulveratus flavus TaxID=3031728 RepID=UPI0023B1D7F3|nr:DUF3152 domain-containing protein [Luteipulveratus sp. YIM 133132]MDE9367905.1 DUF3152 domain-containing protein [Luteipulveratus sp. YIM 133132]
MTSRSAQASRDGERRGADSGLRARRAIAAAAVVLAVGSAVLGLLHDDPASAEPRHRPEAARPSSPSAARPSPSSSGSGARRAAAATPTSGTPTTSVPDRGDGRLTPVLVPGADSRTQGRAVTYALEIEGGLGADTQQVARTVGEVLRDPRGWQAQDKVRFVQVTPQQRSAGTHVDVTISLVSPSRVDQMCAPLETSGLWSCANKDHAVLNYRRWAEATPTYGGKVDPYRVYQINHEVGHELGHPHAECPGPGRPAPVMLQQSMSLGGCVPNAFPTVTRG